MWNPRLDEAQAGIKITRRNINNLRYADDTTLMAESEELKSLLMKVKQESEKAGLKLNIQKTNIMASSSITSWQIDGETMEIVSDFILGGSKITADGNYNHEIKRSFLLGRKAVTNLSSVLFSCLVMSDSLQPHEMQHTRPPCPSPTPEVYSDSCLLSQWCHLTIWSSVVPSPPAFNLSQDLVFSNDATLCIRWPKFWSFSFRISPSKEYPGLFSFKMDWLDLLAIQGTLKSLLQHHSSKASIL